MLEKNKKTIYLAGGCFWGTEKFLSLINGVVDTEVGYANGKTKNPTYEDVCRRNTGHAEAVKVTYDTEKVSLKEILWLFFETIDPTSKNRQGNDVGAQYRTGIYYQDEDYRQVILDQVKELSHLYSKLLEIEVMPLINYYRAEEYHQKYLDKNPNGYCHITADMFNKAKNFIPS
ncbi:MAG: peptide-methionine (S)-S-oxide reductase MsrA [Clostridiales bacterium]|nr:peptide-methionine (S)-S-oxide reductase MsrA [Clostridiales bacterium]